MNSTKTKILFVEDDEVDQLAFKRQVEKQKLNYEFHFSSSSTEAIDFLKTNTFDIVISDYNLGDGTAIDLLECVKKTPLIVTTGAGDEDIAISTMKAGAYDYLVKDYKRRYLTALPAIIDKAIKHKAETQQFEMLSTVLMNINDMVVITDIENRIVFVNDAFVNNYGYTRSELIGQNIEIVRSKNNPENLTNILIEETLKGGWKGEVLNKRKDGTEFAIFLSTSVIYDQDGNPTHLFGVSNDITESKKAKEELAAEKERLSVTLHNIRAGVITTDNKGIINSMNKAAEEITGWNQEAAIGNKITKIFGSSSSKDQVTNLVDAVLRFGEQVRSEEAKEVSFSIDNTKMIIDNAAPIKDDCGNMLGVVLAFEDVSDKLTMEEELRKAQKLESLGILAGGIAHDFNNILTSIIGNISLAMIHVKPADKVYSNLEGALNACERTRDLTHQLLTFAKGGAPIKEDASIVDIVKESAEFATRGSSTRCRFNIGDDLCMVEVDKGQINQVINNLVINATQAMPQGGHLDIEIMNVTDKKELSKIRFLKEKLSYIKIIIRDEGIGISEKVINQIFDPYFTTKMKGSGLGLASSYSIIKQHDGYIGVESKENEGSTFTIYLPAIPGKKVKKIEKKTKIVKGNAKILVMDDEEMICDVVNQMLTSLGYDITLTENGDEAIKVYIESLKTESPFDLLILDMTIPGGKGGKETIAELIEINPKIKAIVTSGYSEDPVMANFADYGFCGRLTKPFDLKTLSMTIKEKVEKQ